jgi:hypothetical protein
MMIIVNKIIKKFFLMNKWKKRKGDAISLKLYAYAYFTKKR